MKVAVASVVPGLGSQLTSGAAVCVPAARPRASVCAGHRAGHVGSAHCTVQEFLGHLLTPAVVLCSRNSNLAVILVFLALKTQSSWCSCLLTVL